MVKYSNSFVMLMGSASLFAVMATKPVKSQAIDDQGLFARISAAPKNLWEAMPDVRGTVQAKATTFAKQKAQTFVNQQAGQLAEVATKKYHALMYRHADVHVVNDDGVHVGFIEDNSPRIGRNLIQKALGVDLDRDLPGVPIFMAKAVNNMIEKQAASYLEAGFQKHLNSALTQLTMKSLEMGLGLAQTQATNLLAPSKTSIEEEKEIKAALAKATPVNEILAPEDLSVMSEFVMFLQAKLKLKIHAWLNDVANETATSFINKFMNQTEEGLMRGGEVAAGTALTLAAGAATGGTGGAIIGGLVYGDHYIAEGTPEEKSYGRQAMEWLRWKTGADVYRDKLEEKITIATTNQINGNIDAVLKQVGAGALILSEKDYELVNGKYALVEDESGFWNMEITEGPYSLTTFANRIVNNFKRRAASALRTVQVTATQVKEAAPDLYDAFADMGMAMGPGLGYEEPEPRTMEILENRASDALEEGNTEEIGEIYQQIQEKKIEEENAAKNSWWKFW